MKNQIEPSDYSVDHANDFDPGEPEEDYNDAYREPVLSVDVINRAYADLVEAYAMVKQAKLERIELDAGTYNLIPKASEVKKVEAEAQCALDCAKAEVDRITTIQTFFQLASLNNLAESMPEE